MFIRELISSLIRLTKSDVKLNGTVGRLLLPASSTRIKAPEGTSIVNSHSEPASRLILLNATSLEFKTSSLSSIAFAYTCKTSDISQITLVCYSYTELDSVLYHIGSPEEDTALTDSILISPYVRPKPNGYKGSCSKEPIGSALHRIIRKIRKTFNTLIDCNRELA